MVGFHRFLGIFAILSLSSCATVTPLTPVSKAADTQQSSIKTTSDHQDKNPGDTQTEPKLAKNKLPKEAAALSEKPALEKPEQIFLTKQKPAANPNQTIWTVIQNNLVLGYDSEHDRVTKERKRYTKNPDYLKKVTKRAEPYLFHITKSLTAANLPLELIALPIVESAYKTTARSKQGAEGLWQFIRSTGKNYELHRDWWNEDRRDPVKSTQAAIAYLKHLNTVFDGDWLLSLAAYNAGEHAINRAIKKNRKRGLPEDYWSLKLPKETMKYVPRFLAVVSILENPDFYNIKLHPVKNTGYFEPVTVAGRTSLTRLAQQLKLDKQLVLDINARHRRGVTPPDQRSTLLLPQEAAAHYQSIQTEIASKIEIAALTHQVRKGETLSHISKHYGIPVVKIKANNKIRGSLIRPGQKLHIPES